MDPIFETLQAIYESVMANPAARGLIVGAVRNITGFIYTKWYEKTGVSYEPKKAAATIIKYEVIVNALATVLPPEQAAAITLVGDILFGAARKMLQSRQSPVPA